VRYYSALVIRDLYGDFLTVNHIKKTEHVWRFVGGKIEGDEMPIVAAARELKEELGIVPTSLRLVGTPVVHCDGDDWMGFFFIVDSFDGNICIQEPDKHGEIRYLSVAELARLGSYPECEIAGNIRLRRL
jgi:8-oxo-dGTP pyrophosphatase MutT (NUDIX family)